jgi:hypothetical protein
MQYFVIAGLIRQSLRLIKALLANGCAGQSLDQVRGRA